MAFAAGKNHEAAAQFIAFMLTKDNAAKLAQFFPSARESLNNAETLAAVNPVLTEEQLQAVVVDGVKEGKLAPGHTDMGEIAEIVRADLEAFWSADAGVRPGRREDLRGHRPAAAGLIHHMAITAHEPSSGGRYSYPPTRARRSSMKLREELTGYLFTLPQLLGLPGLRHRTDDRGRLLRDDRLPGADRHLRVRRTRTTSRSSRTTRGCPRCSAPRSCSWPSSFHAVSCSASRWPSSSTRTSRNPAVPRYLLHADAGLDRRLDHRLAVHAPAQRLHQRRPRVLPDQRPHLAARAGPRDDLGDRRATVQGRRHQHAHLLAALQGVPKDLVEAAKIDGAGRWTIARKITLPLISPEILMVTILMTIGAFKTFQQILLLTQGGPGYSTTVLAYYVYQKAFQQNDFGYASALALLLFVILLVITGLTWQLRKRVVFHESD